MHKRAKKLRHLTTSHAAVLEAAIAAQRNALESYLHRFRLATDDENDHYRYSGFRAKDVDAILGRWRVEQRARHGHMPVPSLRYLKELTQIGMLIGHQYRVGGQWRFNCLRPKWRALMQEATAAQSVEVAP